MSYEIVQAQPQGLMQQSQEMQPASMGNTYAAAQASALVQARIVMALQRPRNVMAFRTKLLAECQRPGFAATAVYAKPQGWKKDQWGKDILVDGKKVRNFIEGLSIRAMETAAQFYGNLDAAQEWTYDQGDSRHIVITTLDLENNTSFTSTGIVKRTVERQPFYKNGEEQPFDRLILSERKNSDGKKVYTTPATEDELRSSVAAEKSKMIRTNLKRILPADILAEAEAICKQAKEKSIKDDPKAALLRMVDAFSKLHVSPTDIEQFMGQSLDKLSPAQLVELRNYYTALETGELTLAELMNMSAETDPEKAEAAKNQIEKAVAEAKAAKAARAAAKAAETAPTAPTDAPTDQEPAPQDAAEPPADAPKPRFQR